MSKSKAKNMTPTKKLIISIVVILNILGLVINPLLTKNSEVKIGLQISTLILSGVLLLGYEIVARKEKKKKGSTLYELIGIVLYGVILVVLLRTL